eukprot:CAMPEP_0115889692 /NCGR_PEP_ID=MMETSP0287-20121206/32955_1 /TAXON_ID=412157 /ORGANISM="Chrysochromulina rotalis, Strain UIO044" /LENGTH=37 /DNA_ID= /DNA_START= /DNA_END= /DNA_ORIENTATION=
MKPRRRRSLDAIVTFESSRLVMILNPRRIASAMGQID